MEIFIQNVHKYHGLAPEYVNDPKALALTKESHTIKGNMDVQLEIIYERYGHWSIYELEINKNKKKERKYVNFYVFFSDCHLPL